MKILFVMDSLGTGGAERSTVDLWHFLRDQGVELRAVVLRNVKEGTEQSVLASGFNVTFTSNRGFWSDARVIRAQLRDFQPDIVHSILFKSNLRVRVCRAMSGFGHIESLVNCTYDPIRYLDPRVNRPALRLYKLVDRMSAPMVDGFLAISHEVKAHYQRELGISCDRIEVIERGRQPNGYLDERESHRSRCLAEFSLAPETVILVHVGRQEYQKGHLVLLEAIRKLEETSSFPIAVLFLGRDGGSSAEIQAYLSRNTLRAKLIWLGYRHDVPLWLVSSDIFVFPSLYEGLGGALIEAQAAGLPIVCSALPVLKEVVREDWNALMFERGNSTHLASCLERLIGDAALRRTMGSLSLSNFHDRFELCSINDKTLRFYRAFLDSLGARR